MADVVARENPTGKLFDDDILSLKQIVDHAGTPYKAFATENVWVGVGQPFSQPRTGNALKAFTTGKAYFSDLASAIQAAAHVIYIAGWQVNWDAELEQGVRLFDVLLKAVKANAQLKVYVMPWMHSPPVQTYDNQTKSVLEAINEIAGRTCVWVTLAASLADDDRSFFSHHQKLIVIDEKTAYIGGMDLAYGRFDDATYDLKADAENRQAMNRYNGCIPHLGHVPKDNLVDPDLLTGMVDNRPTLWGLVPSNHSDTLKKIEGGGYQIAYGDETPYVSATTHPTGLPSNDGTLDASRQPRMPWQDVHFRIDGPSANDVARNFVVRWNSEGGGKRAHLNLPPEPAPLTGGCKVQMLRSAPAAMRQAEFNGSSSADQKSQPAPDGKQCEIALAMRNLITKATSFIYIENQFFVSGFGTEHTDPNTTAANVTSQQPLSGPADQVKKQGFGEWATRQSSDHPEEAPKNFICELLGHRIGRTIMSGVKEHFHVIITLPVHPEGMLNNASVMTQVHWTMQSLVFGSFSLLNRVRRFLKAKELRDGKVQDWSKVLSDPRDTRYEDVDIEKCRKYVTLLNLRNWTKLGERYVTEQIYVHTKMMIVDDLFALVGSANINDRSLLGSRDSEIAVLVADSAMEKHNIDGSGHVKVTRKFARNLRQEVWKKLFGITGNVRPAHQLMGAIDQPANPANWRAIQKVADANQKLYEAAFAFIPRNRGLSASPDDQGDFASIWPTWNPAAKSTEGKMPFDDAFWAKPQHEQAATNLSQLNGFIVSLPIEWTKGENNNLGFATSLVADNYQVPRPANAYEQEASASDKSQSGELS
ncbi:phospholipase D-like domain-containing protein [Paraburkholderia haematera]|uniref:Cardiolipin synthase n=1 Tax=Paraburkholderia haematera TaxID=2793077 RepID=A0ABM8RXX7_9BURK|nr:phospholipase D-like domain-containing protein [Paraburkholderia haematera]CAE6777675.1 Cardiolipin synthase [Paraburkholderia haematera]